MTLTIELSAEIEAGLSALAKAHGLALPQYLQHLLEEQVAGRPVSLTPAERVAAWRSSVEGMRHKDTPPQRRITIIPGGRMSKLSKLWISARSRADRARPSLKIPAETICRGMRETTRSKGKLLGLLPSAALSALIILPLPTAHKAQAFAGLEGGQHWVGTWGASPSDPLPEATTPTASYNNQTLREKVHISIGGTKIRLRLSNALGRGTLVIGAVHVARTAGLGTTQPQTDRTVTFGGQGSAQIPPGALAISDEINLPVAALSDLSISIFLPQDTGPATVHSLGTETTFIVSGDHTKQATLANPTTTTIRPFLSSVEVKAGPETAAVVTLGDSITDGFRSTVDADTRWPDDLARLLEAAFGNKVGVINAGIGGGRVLHEGAGPNALERLDRDVLAQPGVKYVTLLEGINDISNSAVAGQGATADQIIAGYKQIIARAHDQGLLIYGATLTPFSTAPAAREQEREAVNNFIRSSNAFDAVIDFDLAVRDPKNPNQFLPAFDSGDHLHPNDLGYAAMAKAVPLSLFRPRQ